VETKKIVDKLKLEQTHGKPCIKKRNLQKKIEKTLCALAELHTSPVNHGRCANSATHLLYGRRKKTSFCVEPSGIIEIHGNRFKNEVFRIWSAIFCIDFGLLRELLQQPIVMSPNYTEQSLSHPCSLTSASTSTKNYAAIIDLPLRVSSKLEVQANHSKEILRSIVKILSTVIVK
jgi:hypothetical protein